MQWERILLSALPLKAVGGGELPEVVIANKKLRRLW
jgi:hypothetical protein